MPPIKSQLRLAVMLTMTTTLSTSKSASIAFVSRPSSPRTSTLVNMSSRPPSSPAPKSQNRNRGANAANHNRRGHEFRLNKKEGAIRPRKTNAKRAPRWEREGDQLYAEVSKRISQEEDADETLNSYFLAMKDQPISTVQDVHAFLKPWTIDPSLSMKEKLEFQSVQETSSAPPPQPNNEPSTNKSPPFLWGTLPVGPVLASRLYASQRSSPTSVQKAAFSILTAAGSKGNNKTKHTTVTKRTNAIIASPTGTGKTLAYLLPLLCTSPGGQHGEGTGGVLIVTPTIELACQIQREVNVLWPPDEKRGGHSALYVVGDVEDNDAMEGNMSDETSFLPPGRMILRSIPNSPIIAGTPKMLRMLYREAERTMRYSNIDDTILETERRTSEALVANLRAIVLDEADRLLRTEAVAREAAERKEIKMAQRMAGENEDLPSKKKKLIIARQTQTELLLRDLPIPSLEHVQIICASATVGRTMRRQLMQILDAPSADAAATLITGEDDARVKSKDSQKRKSVLLPEKLQHSYQVVDLSSLGEMTEELSHMSVAEQNEEIVVRATVTSLWDTMLSMEEAKPLLIFPGRIGVERIQHELISRGVEDVRTLRNLDGSSREQIDISDLLFNDAKTADSHRWKSVPVYVIGERFARGLDLPDVEYVAILSPPSSAAGYAHMAGRTGRSGRRGTAITFVRPKNNEVKRLATIADTLGVKFTSFLSNVSESLVEQD
ncbi:hypothetical protein HJC23_010096 [Cyclotella cryptica]|uniref:ATP-dependent RNA helicase n=1 Tax=Cyclotella cryptica TaxID=29204 RepID=A0ABD3Q2U5_9STRA|eukprot:CCRYP_009099-RA/>CCRYP_009099-RA protein AED:0.04 eAED:0.04 QI:0/-1/0/1/-1/1/1/0/721